MAFVSPLPKVLRSRQALIGAPASTLPITQNGTTYEMAQEVRWLDSSHFAVGRWDGSMSIFQFDTAPSAGPVIAEAVNDPASQGVVMVTSLPGNAIATSNDGSSIGLFRTPDGNWSNLAFCGSYSYEATLGLARSGAYDPATDTLVVGHVNGYLSLWSYNPSIPGLEFELSVNVQNPHPVNPWNDHTIEDVVVAAAGVVAAGSEDGYITFLSVRNGNVISQTVFNPAAQRGVNALDISDDRLLVANCAVGPTDNNLWYFAIDQQTWAITLLDKAMLIIDTSLPQVFNFDVAWGNNNGAPCWFASTEEGALWMGEPSRQALYPIGYQQLTGPLGSALAYQNGQLAMVSYDLYQFSTSG